MKKNVLFKNVVFLLMIIMLVNVSSCSSDNTTMVPDTEDPGDEDPGDEDPVDEDPISGDPTIIIKNIQEDFLKFYEGLNMELMQINRQTYMFGAYAGNQGGSDVVNSWRAAYSVLENSSLLQNLNDLETYNVPAYVGMAEVLHAFTFLVSVDIYGNIPYSEAVNPEQFPNPNLSLCVSCNLLLLTIHASRPFSYFQEFRSQNWIIIEIHHKKVYTCRYIRYI